MYVYIYIYIYTVCSDVPGVPEDLRLLAVEPVACQPASSGPGAQGLDDYDLLIVAARYCYYMYYYHYYHCYIIIIISSSIITITIMGCTNGGARKARALPLSFPMPDSAISHCAFRWVSRRRVHVFFPHIPVVRMHPGKGMRVIGVAFRGGGRDIEGLAERRSEVSSTKACFTGDGTVQSEYMANATWMQLGQSVDARNERVARKSSLVGIVTRRIVVARLCIERWLVV